jgi:hypothetical protein
VPRLWITERGIMSVKRRLAALKHGAQMIYEALLAEELTTEELVDIHVGFDRMDNQLEELHKAIEGYSFKWGRRGKKRIIPVPSAGSYIPMTLIVPVVVDCIVDGFLVGSTSAISVRAGLILGEKRIAVLLSVLDVLTAVSPPLGVSRCGEYDRDGFPRPGGVPAREEVHRLQPAGAVHLPSSAAADYARCLPRGGAQRLGGPVRARCVHRLHILRHRCAAVPGGERAAGGGEGGAERPGVLVDSDGSLPGHILRGAARHFVLVRSAAALGVIGGGSLPIVGTFLYSDIKQNLCSISDALVLLLTCSPTSCLFFRRAHVFLFHLCTMFPCQTRTVNRTVTACCPLPQLCSSDLRG